MLKILLDKQPRKFLQKQEKSVQLRIYNALQGLKEIPPVGDIRKMQGRQDSYRLRVGTYRAIYTIDYVSETVHILTIDNRGSIY
ncbi:type II toxin-antitoxin system RelE family toxin [Metasolibacillus meyeri]|uniref:type II toxin-antitoxin system RelE family toxin n=1 Tax=Metasolibacillus meyeri TaxID=1071052 RepID=UPI000D31C397|nr:type II toxin-antitoxin system RelE/ParE family toxin [Metasolibacillus meyeri]